MSFLNKLYGFKNKIIKNVSVFQFIVAAIIALVCFTIYQYSFFQIQENFIEYDSIIKNKKDFTEYADIIQNKIQEVFPSASIDMSFNDVMTESSYFKRLTNQDLYDYVANDSFMFHWDDKTVELYRKYLDKKGFKFDNISFNNYKNKLRRVYNQLMILEVMSEDTTVGNFLKNGVVFNGNKILTPYNNHDILKTNHSVLKCKNGKLQEFKHKNSELDLEGLDINFNKIDGLIFKNPETKCNPCDAVGDPSDEKYSCKYNLHFQGGVDNKIWNKLWSDYGPTDVN